MEEEKQVGRETSLGCERTRVRVGRRTFGGLVGLSSILAKWAPTYRHISRAVCHECKTCQQHKKYRLLWGDMQHPKPVTHLPPMISKACEVGLFREGLASETRSICPVFQQECYLFFQCPFCAFEGASLRAGQHTMDVFPFLLI